MKKEEMTMEKLAIMVKNGFDVTATKEEMRGGFGVMDKRFNEVEKRLDRIENLLIRDHSNKIERLEDSMRIVKTKLGIR